ncbi:probable tRNA N6-adenosine threonylcarbamoyltransferase, mitochondrial [Uranotaenia lowii]|uniref:probable tRNA N6-adenosine threonylcarbamoyltransferase, mitochondrial n=1 Tax=Uranotaenia lowii TaxID=190385 RepID=UPI0024786BE9|nr:probable tRNA N6-adenosine threonylcarbamoyltransferase, mitochondrial [Uranotaenia lowii]
MNWIKLQRPGLKLASYRNYHQRPEPIRPYVLGIETSCDDSGAAIVSSNGIVLAESLHSQQNSHLRFGGIIPPLAQDFHRYNVEKTVQGTMTKAKLGFSDIDAIAVTNRPGLPLSLLVGVRKAKYLARKMKKPLIPIHHMEAHALMARMENELPFPFVCILLSGGHAILTFVKDESSFYLLGETLDDAPGQAFDKIARRLKLRNIPKYSLQSGGQAVETAAKNCVDSSKYPFPLPLAQYRDCNFSFAGLKNTAFRHITKEETVNELPADYVIPDYKEFCYGFLLASAKHIVQRTERAIRFCEKNLYDNTDVPRSLVVSGGVARNDFIYDYIGRMASSHNYKIYRPSKELCSDNGVMIAWNGIEKFRASKDVIFEYDSIDIYSKAPLGICLKEMVASANIPNKWKQR